MRLLSLFFISFILFSLLVIIFPNIDLVISSFFYDDFTHNFPSNLLLDFLKDLFQSIAVWIFIVLLLVLAIIYSVTKQVNYQIVFLISTLFISALIIEVVMKNAFGRARPRDIIEFNGELIFTRAYEISNQCDFNCSFVSGHAGIGFYFLCFGFLARRTWAFIPGLALGFALSYTRIAQGGHFFSDVIIAGYVTFFIAWINAKYWLPK
ncbi:phosphatase PAP2 family protein [Marinicellulosiphila megalodicopiae]|uniref:phosphatase PAP2 family protein n=1 Tax=Marinicellulosiphila megalodicopiae TaxID=2724896 RepID=UPI003BB1F40B